MYACDKRGCAFQTNDLRALIRHAELQHQSANIDADTPIAYRLTAAGWLASTGLAGNDGRNGKGPRR